jgi:general secretion pathway protein D
MGNLFSSTIEEAGRTELIVTLTPRVITNPNEAYEISQELRQKIKDAARIDDDYRK